MVKGSGKKGGGSVSLILRGIQSHYEPSSLGDTGAEPLSVKPEALASSLSSGMTVIEPMGLP